MTGPRRKVLGNGRGQIGAILNLAQRNFDQIHKPGRNHDYDTWCNPIAEGSTRIRLKQQINWKVEDIEAGYDVLLAELATDNPEYVRLNAIVEETIGRRVNISQRMVQALGAAPTAQEDRRRPLPELEWTSSSSRRAWNRQR